MSLGSRILGLWRNHFYPSLKYHYHTFDLQLRQEHRHRWESWFPSLFLRMGSFPSDWRSCTRAFMASYHLEHHFSQYFRTSPIDLQQLCQQVDRCPLFRHFLPCMGRIGCPYDHCPHGIRGSSLQRSIHHVHLAQLYHYHVVRSLLEQSGRQDKASRAERCQKDQLILEN